LVMLMVLSKLQHSGSWLRQPGWQLQGKCSKQCW
jgi:hypothetical protein